MDKRKDREEDKEEIEGEEDKEEDEEEKDAEEKQEEKANSSEEKKNKVDYSKQTKVILSIMAIILVSFAVTYFLAQDSKTVNYHKIKFSKEEAGGIMHYKSLLGYVTGTGETVPFVLQLRTDPKELEKVFVKADIQLLDKAIISLSPEIIDCNDTSVTLIDLSMTLKAFGTSATGATTDEELARKNNTPFADCRNSSEKTVIILRGGNETKIIQEKEFSKNCYVLEINNCEVRKAYEKFLVHYIENSINIDTK
jgi:hypothetical protein